MNETPYLYSEDSNLLGKFLSNLEGSGSYLEIGAGNGGNLLEANRGHKFENVVGTDIFSLDKIREELPRDVELVLADKASCFRAGTFDVVAFNPPYVPSIGIQDPTTDGGYGGIEIPLLFLSSALFVLKENGIVVMILSSEDSLKEVETFCSARNLILTRALETKLFFESLYVFVVSRKK
jgi:release factor glutamine methyltransferase